MTPIVIRQITHGSPEYGAEVALREQVLRRPLGLHFSADELSAEASSYHLGSFIGDTLIGCLVLRPSQESLIQMRQVAVDSAMQGKGIGTELVRYSEKFARDQGFAEMMLHARETAVHFYERLGYGKIGDQFLEVTIPHWEMRKTLRGKGA